MKKVLKLCVLTIAIALSLQTLPASAFDTGYATSVFSKLSVDPRLRNPSVVLMDAQSGEVLFESNANSQRKPASIIKILSAAAAIKHIPLEKRYETILSQGTEENSLVIQGQLDPWFSLRSIEAKKMHRTSVPRIASRGLNELQELSAKRVRTVKVIYSGLYARDLVNLKMAYKKKGVSLKVKKVSSEEASSLVASEILRSTSPTVDEMVKWFLTWSDNALSERIARHSAKAAGYSLDNDGVNIVFTSLLQEMGIDSSRLVVDDASGLSRDNRITAQLVSQILFKIHKDPIFANLIEGLPDGGETGTLKKRFLDTAPNAVGLVHAKTGTLNGTVNLAGYVEAGQGEYIFVIIADQLPRGYTPSKVARNTVDRYLGKIALPIIPEISAIPTPEIPVIALPVA